MSNNDASGEFTYELADTANSISLSIENLSNFDIGIRDFAVAGYTVRYILNYFHHFSKYYFN